MLDHIILLLSCICVVFGGTPCETNSTVSDFLTNLTLPTCTSCASRCGSRSDIDKDVHCSCDDLCPSYRDCCYDYQDQCQGHDPRSEQGYDYGKSSCLSEHRLYVKTKKNPKNVLIISSCPKGGPKCVGSSSSADSYVPVYDPTTQLHYLNFKCALCNNANEAIPWNMHIYCHNNTSWAEAGYNISDNVAEQQFPDIWSLFADFQCFADVSYREDMMPPRKCGIYDITDTCKDDCKNDKIEAACSGGGMKYIASGFKSYANLGCLLCNNPQGMDDLHCTLNKRMGGRGGDTDPIFPVENKVSFSLLFDFNIKKKVPKCPVGQQWVPDDRRCRRLITRTYRPTDIPRGEYQTFVIIVNLDSISSEFNISLLTEQISTEISNMTLFSVKHDKNMLTTMFLFKESKDYLLQDAKKEILKLLAASGYDTVNIEMFTYEISLLNCTTYHEYYRDDVIVGLNGTLAIRSRNVYPGEYLIINSTTIHVCSFNGSLDANNAYTLTTRDIVTIVFGVISIISLMLRILLHYILAIENDKVASRSQLCLAVALLIAFASFLVRVAAFSSGEFCYFLAVVSHWGFLAAFCWMTVIAIDIVRMLKNSLLLRKVGSRRKSFVFFSLFAWLAPLLIVCICIGLNHGDLDPEWKPKYTYSFRCWISTRNTLLVFFVIPAAILFTINIILFIMAVCYIRSTSKDTLSKDYKSNKRRLLLHVNLLTLMGLTWVFGFLAAPLNEEWLWYIFIILNALQGVFLLLVFLISQAVRRVIRDASVKWYSGSSVSRTNTSTGSSGLSSDTEISVSMKANNGTNLPSA